MKNLINYILSIIIFAGILISSCTRKILFYKSSEFPLTQTQSTQLDPKDKAHLFNKMIYVMRIYEVEDTFTDDTRQKYINHRTVTELKEKQMERYRFDSDIVNNKRVQTICLVFLDEERVLYYTMLQNSTVNNNPLISGYPSKICLNDTTVGRDLTSDNKQYRHYYHGIYRIVEDSNKACRIEMKFQNTFPNIKTWFFQCKKKREKNEKALEANKNKFFVSLLGVIDTTNKITIDTIGYSEENILAQNQDVYINVKNVFGSKFTPVFTGINLERVQQMPDDMIDYEIIYDSLNKKTQFRTFLKKKIIENEINSKNFNNYKKLLKYYGNYSLDTLKALDFKVDSCIVSFPFLNNNERNKDSCKIEYFITRNGKSTHYPYMYQLSSSIIEEIKKAYPKGTRRVAVNKNTYLGFNEIYNKLSIINKKDFSIFISTISAFDSYRARFYKNKEWYEVLENNLVSIKTDSFLNKPNDPLAITFKLIADSGQISNIKKCSRCTNPYNAYVEFEFKIDSIKQVFDEKTKILIRKYYIGDIIRDKDKRIVFIDTINNISTYMPNWENFLDINTVQRVNEMKDKMTLEKFKNKNFCKDKNDCYYIKEEISGQAINIQTW